MRIGGRILLKPGAALAVFAMAALITVVLAACSEKTTQAEAKPAPASIEKINAESTITPRPTPVAALTPQEKALAQAPAAPASETSSGAILEEGKLIFEKRAGNIGCAYCHGLDGKGKPESGAPPVRGKSEDEVKAALATRIQMGFINLNEQEIKAVAAYLKLLEGNTQ